MKLVHIPLLLLVLICCPACQNKKAPASKEVFSRATYTSPLLPVGAEPWAVLHEGKYYYTQGAENKIIPWETNDITDLEHATRKEVWIPKEVSSSYHLRGPEIHRIDGKWYVYSVADDDNMDNHHIYMIKNVSASPLKDEFVTKERIKTDRDDNWVVHTNTLEHRGEYCLIWCEWPKQRVETETQCIYIAKMENPWALPSDRMMISEPEHEWKRQWISPDDSKTAYPTHVNEAPQFSESKSKDEVLIYCCASGNWTPCYYIGLLTVDAGSDLTDAASWRKLDTPAFERQSEDSVFGPGNPSLVPSSDGKEWYMLYHARRIPDDTLGATDLRSPCLQKISWGADGMLPLGKLRKEGINEERKTPLRPAFHL